MLWQGKERLGIDTEEYFFREDFEDIINFNTPETLNALGFATSDIAEMGLAEIAKTIMSLEKQNRIIAETRNSDYNVVKENQTERSLENDRIDLHDAGRLQTAQSDRTGSVGNSDGTLLSTESEVPEGKPQSSVLQFLYKSKVMGEIKTLTAYRTHLRNEIRKVNIDDDSLSTAKLKISAISEKLSELRKDVRLCDAIAERSDAMKENLEAVLADEEKIKGKENQSYEQRR